jgi:hypothetical protein
VLSDFHFGFSVFGGWIERIPLYKWIRDSPDEVREKLPESELFSGKRPPTNCASSPIAVKWTSSTTAAATADVQSMPAAIKTLEQIKAGNAEVLAKQKAALEKLDGLQDAADQLRIFAERG